jgi:hypothetical protein
MTHSLHNSLADLTIRHLTVFGVTHHLAANFKAHSSTSYFAVRGLWVLGSTKGPIGPQFPPYLVGNKMKWA